VWDVQKVNCTQEKPWAREVFMHSKRPRRMRSLRDCFQKRRKSSRSRTLAWRQSSLPLKQVPRLVRLRYRNQLRRHSIKKCLSWLLHCRKMFVLVHSEQSYVKLRCDNRNRSLCSSCNKVALEAMWKSTNHVIIGSDKDISSPCWFLQYCSGL